MLRPVKSPIRTLTSQTCDCRVRKGPSTNPVIFVRFRTEAADAVSLLQTGLSLVARTATVDESITRSADKAGLSMPILHV